MVTFVSIIILSLYLVFYDILCDKLCTLMFFISSGLNARAWQWHARIMMNNQIIETRNRRRIQIKGNSREQEDCDCVPKFAVSEFNCRFIFNGFSFYHLLPYDWYIILLVFFVSVFFLCITFLWIDMKFIVYRIVLSTHWFLLIKWYMICIQSD